MIASTIYTITKGNYKYGVIALINSLRFCGIENEIIVGTDKEIIELTGHKNIKQIIIDSDWNPTNLKGKLILDNPANSFIFFDADIIVSSAKFVRIVEKYIEQGKFCTVIDGIVPHNDHRRHLWRTVSPSDIEIPSPWYYNAGFFAGNSTLHFDFLMNWLNMIETTLDPTKFLFENDDFPMADQDIYNCLLQNVATADIVSFSPSDWLGISTQLNPFFQIGNFRPNAFIHCTGEHKPWKIIGLPKQAPNEYDIKWYDFIFNPENTIKANFRLNKVQHQWFKNKIQIRILRKIKNRLNLS
ncbi:hypothetical protein [Pedobacter sp. Leaf250]|uniref:hypothetical protein n=1 Tax=Pedobacter sp. Leaf250 TaxID=2876559 RepID=UPI001E35CE0D|nr:hypothetical protein [Pedobacter sp. Leaf250]